MQAVRAFHNRNRTRRDDDGRQKLVQMAVVTLQSDARAFEKSGKHVPAEPLDIHVSARHCKPFGSTHAWLQEKVVHMEDACVQPLRQLLRCGRFTGSALTVDGK